MHQLIANAAKIGWAKMMIVTLIFALLRCKFSTKIRTVNMPFVDWMADYTLYKITFKEDTKREIRPIFFRRHSLQLKTLITEGTQPFPIFNFNLCFILWLSLQNIS